MIVILDASTLINLDNGNVFAEVISIPNRSFQVSKEVLRESRTVAAAIQFAVQQSQISLVDDSLIDSTDFATAITEWRLGPGETECILAAKVLGCTVACDDRTARKVIKREIGDARMTGTVGLLRAATAATLLDTHAAFESYQKMKACGGFLPDLTLADFRP